MTVWKIYIFNEIIHIARLYVVQGPVQALAFHSLANLQLSLNKNAALIFVIGACFLTSEQRL